MGFLEGDEATGEHKESKVVLSLLAPTDEQRPVAVEPGVAGLDHPPSGSPAGGVCLQVNLFAAA